MRGWTLYIVTDLVSKVAHWTAETREGCRRELRLLKAQCAPRKIRTIIERS